MTTREFVIIILFICYLIADLPFVKERAMLDIHRSTDDKDCPTCGNVTEEKRCEECGQNLKKGKP